MFVHSFVQTVSYLFNFWSACRVLPDVSSLSRVHLAKMQLNFTRSNENFPYLEISKISVYSVYLCSYITLFVGAACNVEVYDWCCCWRHRQSHILYDEKEKLNVKIIKTKTCLRFDFLTLVRSTRLLDEIDFPVYLLMHFTFLFLFEEFCLFFCIWVREINK